MGSPESLRCGAILDFWNSCAQLDSMFQKSLLLSRSVGDRLGKIRRLAAMRAPKILEFAP
jgi:hypothetical protein